MLATVQELAAEWGLFYVAFLFMACERRANLAIVDSKFLCEALDDADGDIDAAAKIFNDRRFNRVRSFQDWQLVRFLLIDIEEMDLVHRH